MLKIGQLGEVMDNIIVACFFWTHGVYKHQSWPILATRAKTIMTRGAARFFYTYGDSDVISSYHIYASCFPPFCGACSAKHLLYDITLIVR